MHSWNVPRSLPLFRLILNTPLGLYLFLGENDIEFSERFGTPVVQCLHEDWVGVLDSVSSHLMLFLLEDDRVLHVLGSHFELGRFRLGYLLQVPETTQVGAVDPGRNRVRAVGVEERSSMCWVVEHAAVAAHGRVALVTEERQRIARMNRTTGGPGRRNVHAGRRAGWTTHGEGRRGRRRRRGEGDNAMPREVGHLAVRALARRTDRVLASDTLGD